MKDTDTSILLKVIDEQNKTIESLNNTIEEMSVNIKLLREQIEYLNKKLYGTKSEKTSVLDGQIVIDEVFEYGQFNEAETSANLTEDIKEDLPTKKASRKGYSREKALGNLPREEKLYTLTDAEKVCSVDGDRLFPAGKKYLRTEIEYTPASLKLVEIYVETAECRTCRKEGRSFMIKAEPDQPVLQHSMASPSSVAWTMYQKYVNHVPLYRQEKDWHNLGLEIRRNTLSNWIMKTSEEWLAPVVARLQEKLLEDAYIHADETPVQVMREPGRSNRSNSYMWVYTSSRHSERPIRIFDYRTGRAGAHASEFLTGFQGYLHTDAYAGYEKVKGVTRCLCWSHNRRYFHDALPKDLKSGEATLPRKGVRFCNELFKIEELCKDLPPEDRQIKRLELAVPVLEAYWAWVKENADKVLPKSKIGKAFQYTLNQKEGLMNYLKDGHCEISNNIAENSIRPFTVGRRNWLFSGSPKGASASAIVYSLVETAKANGLNPYKYLNLLLEILPRFSTKERSEGIEQLLPWKPQVKKECST